MTDEKKAVITAALEAFELSIKRQAAEVMERIAEAPHDAEAKVEMLRAAALFMRRPE